VFELLASGEDEADEIHSEYLDFVIEAGRETEVTQAFWRHLQARRDWDELRLGSVPCESPALGALRAAAADAAVTYRESPRAPAVVVPLAGDEGTFLGAQKKKMREDLRRHRRMLESHGPVHFRRAATSEELHTMFATFQHLHQELWRSRGKPGCFASAKFTAFHQRVSQRLFAVGMADLILLEVGERPIAARYSFNNRGRLFEYQSGLDPAFDPRISSGVQCGQLCMEDAIRRGFTVYDLGEGRQPYKLRWTHELRANVDVVISRRTTVAMTNAVLATAEGWLRAAKRAWTDRGQKG
jgi:CelD/BcsL family acetyltransferase involved in cellulose biosynthesis